ncbi:MAG: MMPL family transporter [Dehalococcoidia bacterium]|nr:MAG: MMPL family transporter [Dehalococcoidia bacterium]
MLSFLSPERLARSSARRPWLTLAVWAIVIVIGAVAATTIQYKEEWTSAGSESAKAQALVDQMRGETVNETVLVQSTGATVDDPAYRAFTTDLVSRIRGLDGTVKSATSFYESGDTALVSADRTETIIPVALTGTKTDAVHTVVPLLKLLDEQSASGQGFTVTTAGDGSIAHDINQGFERDLANAEILGLPVALIVLIVVFGAAVAASVPVVLGLLGIVLAVGATALISRVFGITSAAVNMITMIGLAVGIDYTLFIVERFREERAKGVEKQEAIAQVSRTASRAVLFSGLTVLIALTGLLIVPSSAFRGMAIGAIFVVAAAVAIAMTMLPAMLSLLDGKLNWLHLPGQARPRTAESPSGFWNWTANAVMRRPLVAIVASVALLGGLAVPFATINLGDPGLSEMPGDLEAVRAFRVLDRDFSAGRVAPAEIVINGQADSAAVAQATDRLRGLVAADPAFGELGQLETSDDGRVGALRLIVNGDPTGSAALSAVERLRNDYVPQAFDGSGATVYVGGQTASTTDYVDTMNRYLPIVIAFVLSLSFVLLMVAFRSIIIPIKAMLMNLLSVGAAYGLLVIVFQWGIGASWLGFKESDTIAAFLPVFLFAVLFGLSMDYHVFLLSRIQERFGETRDNGAAVAYGVRSTARIITGAAAIMITVFAGFSIGDMVPLQQMGFGLAVAVLLDATIVRSVLVPASMAMLGEWNWYLPSWLEWLPKISVEGAPRRAPAVPAAQPAMGAIAREYAGAGGD